MNKQFKVVPICPKQGKDVRPEHVLFNGKYRLCDTYSGGGGYDQFGRIYKKRFGTLPHPVQFVVQLHGCPLKCSYCYVTPDGVHGDYEATYTDTLITDFTGIHKTKHIDVFHLMGGAPALYLEHWMILARHISSMGCIFHSDFLGVEMPYKREWIQNLPGLHAVSIKNPKDVGVPYNVELLMYNLKMLLTSNVQFYLTFTGEPALRDKIEAKFGSNILLDSFCIDIKKYKALE